MDTQTWLALKEDISRLIPIIARRNGCTDSEVVSVMESVAYYYINKD